MSSSSFHNEKNVQNQAGIQNIYGDLHVYGESTTPQQVVQLHGTDLDPMQTLDDDIHNSLAFDRMLDRRSNIDMPHTRTCEWIFHTTEYRDWQAAKSGLLWIKGKPGSGKSTLMSHLYRQIWSERSPKASYGGIYLEFFFSARGLPLQHTPLGMLRSLLNQIFERDVQVRSMVRRSFQEKCALFGHRTQRAAKWEWQRSELEALLMEVVLAAAAHRQIIIFIDALDEAGQQDAQLVARYLHKINKRVVDASLLAKICISCRHYPIPSLVCSTELYVEQNNHHDIVAYVKDCLDADNLPNDDEWSDVVQDLVHQARGIFQWISLVVPMIERYIADGYSPADVRKWLQQVPPELEDVYKHILQNVVDPRHRPQSFQLFRWVCLAMRPLSVTELHHALATETASIRSTQQRKGAELFIWRESTVEQQVKSCSGGLIELVKSTGRMGRKCSDKSSQMIVQVIHQSVKDFFTTDGVEFFASFIDGVPRTVQKCHGELYWYGYRYLSSADMSHPDNWYYSLNDRYKREQQTGSIESYPLLDYFAGYMLEHGEEAQDASSLETDEQYRLLNQAICMLVQTWNFLDFDHVSPPVQRGTEPPSLAALTGITDMVKQFLSNVSDNSTDAIDGREQSAVDHAVGKGHLSIAVALVSAWIRFGYGRRVG